MYTYSCCGRRRTARCTWWNRCGRRTWTRWWWALLWLTGNRWRRRTARCPWSWHRPGRIGGPARKTAGTASYGVWRTCTASRRPGKRPGRRERAAANIRVPPRRDCRGRRSTPPSPITSTAAAAASEATTMRRRRRRRKRRRDGENTRPSGRWCPWWSGPVSTICPLPGSRGSKYYDDILLLLMLIVRRPRTCSAPSAEPTHARHCPSGPHQ